MADGFDSSTVLYTLGIIFGILSVIYFGVEVIVNISPTLKSAMLLLLSVALFSATGLTDSRLKDIPLYFISASSYLVFAAYTMLRFELSSALTFLLLAGSSALFLGGAYLVSEKGIKIKRKHAKIVVPAILILMVGLFVFDLTGPQAESELKLEESVNMTQGEMDIGHVDVRNDFAFSRTFEVSNYRACLPEEDERIIVEMEDRSGLIAGGATDEVDLTLRAVHNISEAEYTLEKSENCLREEGSISVYPNSFD